MVRAILTYTERLFPGPFSDGWAPESRRSGVFVNWSSRRDNAGSPDADNAIGPPSRAQRLSSAGSIPLPKHIGSCGSHGADVGESAFPGGEVLTNQVDDSWYRNIQ